jgi:hypothetical protein
MEDMTSLYLLSFLLTRDDQKAEQCLVSGIEDCTRSSPVFKEWARGWTRRSIVRNAIRLVLPYPNGTSVKVRHQSDYELHCIPHMGNALARVLALKDFERFVFVMSVLERYSDRDCSTLLHCSSQDVHDERIRALQYLSELGTPEMTLTDNAKALSDH